ncbi:hypothetical protein FACS18949_14360 [Clostridia bacterium]|nr:hypothetical protein FACS189425_07170 [Clostridia bacterium]GHV35764.1 hypothetical protein FACS18949_14360 [Clostridia bacterium]
MGGKTSYASIKKYQDKTYDQLLIRIPKGRKEVIQSAAEDAGQSLNGYVVQAVDTRLAQTKGADN